MKFNKDVAKLLTPLKQVSIILVDNLKYYLSKLQPIFSLPQQIIVSIYNVGKKYLCYSLRGHHLETI